MDASACTSLLAAHPDLGINPDTSFNFCNLPGNVCTRCGLRSNAVCCSAEALLEAAVGINSLHSIRVHA